jgi:hypothetical protein
MKGILPDVLNDIVHAGPGQGHHGSTTRSLGRDMTCTTTMAFRTANILESVAHFVMVSLSNYDKVRI